MYELSPHTYARVRPLFSGMDCHLAVAAILAGDAAGQVYADHPTCPRVALVHCGARLYLGGLPDDGGRNVPLQRRFAEMIYPQASDVEDWRFVLAYTPDDWEGILTREILAGKRLMACRHHYYALHPLRHEARPPLPDGYILRLADRTLLAETRLHHLDALRREMCSERPSVEDFLARSFGVCLVYGDELVGWCLSEYNTGGRCEVGIATREGHRRRGLATRMVAALVEQARAQGIRHIGWHCYADNAASIATALKAGFALEREYPVLLV